MSTPDYPTTIAGIREAIGPAKTQTVPLTLPIGLYERCRRARPAGNELAHEAFVAYLVHLGLGVYEAEQAEQGRAESERAYRVMALSQRLRDDPAFLARVESLSAPDAEKVEVKA